MPEITCKGNRIKDVEKFFDAADQLTAKAKELGLDVLIAARTPNEKYLYTYEHYMNDDHDQICHRFIEIAGWCNPKLIDAALSLRDYFATILDARKEP